MGTLNGGQCDYSFIQIKERCDVYIKIFVNDKLDYETKKHENQARGSFTFDYKSPKINKKSARIRIEMYDDDSGFLGSGDDLLMNKTLTIDELTKQKRPRILAGTKNSNDNSIEIERSAWKDEYQSL